MMTSAGVCCSPFYHLEGATGSPLSCCYAPLAGNYAPTLAQWDPCLQLLLPCASPTTLKHPWTMGFEERFLSIQNFISQEKTTAFKFPIMTVRDYVSAMSWRLSWGNCPHAVESKFHRVTEDSSVVSRNPFWAHPCSSSVVGAAETVEQTS